jgi:hypothetical protein
MRMNETPSSWTYAAPRGPVGEENLPVLAKADSDAVKRPTLE